MNRTNAIACLIAIGAAACHTGDGDDMPLFHERQPKADLVAAVQHLDGIVIERHFRDGWHVEKHLPVVARALRFSPDGSTVAWVQDEGSPGAPTPVGYYQCPTDDHAVSLGPLGIRKHAAMGLAVDGTGRIAFLNEEGQLVDEKHNVIGEGSELQFDDHGELAYLDPKGCLIAPVFNQQGALCGNALRPVEYIAGRLLARDNKGVVEFTSSGPSRLAIADVVDARVRRKGEVVAISRVNDHGKVAEAVILARPGLPIAEVLRAPVVVSAELDEDGSVLVVREPARQNPYNVLLAHAPDEFGGQALAGEAVRISLHLKETPIPGLEMEPVRALFRAR